MAWLQLEAVEVARGRSSTKNADWAQTEVQLQNATMHELEEKRGPLEFHRFPVWPVLALRFWDLHLNCMGFRVLRCVVGLTIFCAWVLGIFTQNSYLSGFQSHAVHVL